MEFKRSEASKKRSTLRRVVIEGPIVRVHSRRATAPDGQPAAETLVTFTDLEHFKVRVVGDLEAKQNTDTGRNRLHCDALAFLAQS